MKKVLALVGIVAVMAGVASAWLYVRANQPFRGYTANEQFVEIPSGTGTRAIGERLVSAGVIRDAFSYRLALWMSGRATQLKAGEYRFSDSMTPRQVIDKIARGDVYVTSVTFPEGLTIEQMAHIFEMAGFATAASFVEAARNVSLVSAFDPKARDLEGYLFPDTYALPRRTDAPRLVRLMVERFEHALTAEMRTSAASRGVSVRELVTLASLVEKETAKGEERPLVAAVYSNRMRIGMGLQCDPTVIYALQRAGRFTGNLRREDLAFDSPYNTYRYAGLPPGPIASPGKASLDAAVHPAAVDYLYFVSRNDGSHQFASSLEEHNRNVQKFQVQYFRDLRAGRAGGAGKAGGAGR
jgi:UPF0755 protein